MPCYEFRCLAHGGFERIRPFAESANDAPCPVCRVMSARIVSIPGPSFVKGGGTGAQKGSGGWRLGDQPERNDWIDS